jgi:hypothetical protein
MDLSLGSAEAILPAEWTSWALLNATCIECPVPNTKRRESLVQRSISGASSRLVGDTDVHVTIVGQFTPVTQKWWRIERASQRRYIRQSTFPDFWRTYA